MTASTVAAVRSELLKYFTTRLWWGMAIGIFVSGAAFALLFGLLYTSESYLDQSGDNPFGGAPTGDATQIANSVYTAGLSVGYLLMLVIGVIQIGAEYRHRTITSTFLTQPRRPRVMLGKVLALVLVAAAYGLLSLVGSVLVGAITLQARGAEAFPSAQVFRTLVLSLLVLGLWALIGLGAGILIPNQVAALLIAVGVAWIVEPIAGLAIKQWDFGREHIAPYLPSEASQAVINTALASADDVRLSWWGGAITLVVWAAAFAGVGIVRVVRQDISCQRPPSPVEALERDRGHRVGQLLDVDGTGGAVPLDEGVHHAEQQPADQVGVEVGAQRALLGGLADQGREPGVDPAAPLQRGLLDLAVAVHPQQQGHRGLVVDQHLDAAADHSAQPFVRRPVGRGSPGHRGLELAERLVERLGEQVLLARHVVVDRGLGDAQLLGDVADAGGVVPLAVEEVDRGTQHRGLVVPRSPTAGNGRFTHLGSLARGCVLFTSSDHLAGRSAWFTCRSGHSTAIWPPNGELA